MEKNYAITIIIALMASSLIIAQSVNAQSITKPSTPEFTLKYVDRSYDVAPVTTAKTDPYTGEKTTTTTPGYHVGMKTIEATIKNPSGVSYYNFRWKGHFEDGWHYEPFNPNASLPYFLSDSFSVPYQASTSTYTVTDLRLYYELQSITKGEIDVQVQSLYGTFRAEPYVHVIDVGGPTYDFYFEGTASDWSSTQTIEIGQDASPIPTPTVPELSPLTILPLVLSMLASVAVIKFKNKKRQDSEVNE